MPPATACAGVFRASQHGCFPSAPEREGPQNARRGPLTIPSASNAPEPSSVGKRSDSETNRSGGTVPRYGGDRRLPSHHMCDHFEHDAAKTSGPSARYFSFRAHVVPAAPALTFSLDQDRFKPTLRAPSRKTSRHKCVRHVGE